MQKPYETIKYRMKCIIIKLIIYLVVELTRMGYSGEKETPKINLKQLLY